MIGRYEKQNIADVKFVFRSYTMYYHASVISRGHYFALLLRSHTVALQDSGPKFCICMIVGPITLVDNYFRNMMRQDENVQEY